MLAKLTAKNQITIPKKVVDQLPDVKYFDVQLKDGAVVLKPLSVWQPPRPVASPCITLSNRYAQWD